jgi:hypothetical protein
MAGWKKRGPCATKYQIGRRVPWAVSENAQDREQAGLSLGIVDHHQSLESLQMRLGIFHEVLYPGSSRSE